MSVVEYFFIGYLQCLQNDCGVLVVLWCSLGFVLGVYVLVYFYVECFVGVEWYVYDVWCLVLYLIVGLFVSYFEQGLVSLVMCFGELMKVCDSVSIERCFIVLLFVDVENLLVYL